MALFGNDQDVNLTIKAKDEATATIQKVNTSITGMTGSVFKGVAAWDLLQKAASKAIDFMGESVKAFIDAQRQIDLTRATVESMGQSYDIARPKLDAFGKTLGAVNVDNEQAALAAAQLAKLVGGDLTRGMQVAKLAADLTASGYNDFAGNVDNLSKVLSGKGSRALLDYKLNLDENASTAEQMTAIIGKVTQTTEGLANTVPGQVNEMRVAWEQAKQEIGKGMLPVIRELYAFFKENQDVLNDVATGLSKIVETSALAITGVKGAFQGAGTWIDKAASAALNSADMLTGGLIKPLGEWSKQFDEAGNVLLNDLGKTADHATRQFNALTGATKDTATSTVDVKVATSAYTASLAGLDNVNKGATTSTDKLQNKYEDLADALNKVRQTAVDELGSLDKAHQEASTSAQKSISDIRKSLNDLTDSYNRAGTAAQKAFDQQNKQDRGDVANQVVAEQKKINDLRMQAGMETDPHKKIELVKQLREEEAAYAGQADFIKSIQTEVDAAKAESLKTDFEQAIDAYKEKRAQADQEFADNRADALREYEAKKKEIKENLQQEQDKLDKENNQYSTARAAVVKILADANKMQLETTKSTTEEILKLVDSQIKRYNQLADAIQRASQGKPLQVVSSSSLPIREQGGIVPGPVGSAVPIIAHGQERVIPASQASRGGGGLSSVNLNIYNPVVRSSDDLVAFKTMLDQSLRDLTRVHKLTTI